MNRFCKYALEKLHDEKSPERDSFVSRIYESSDYHRSLCRQPKGVESKLDAFCFAIKGVVELETVNGLKKCYASKGVDRLAILDVKLPITEFYFCEAGNCFKPGFGTYEMNRILHKLHYKRFKKEVVKAWAQVKKYLTQPVLKKSDTLMKPILIIDHGDHVYFVHDEARKEIKIGVSKDVNTRFRTVHRDYGRENLQVIKIVDLGGYDLEAALHEYFGVHRIWPRQEWFRDHKDIHDFIEKLDVGADPWELINASPEADTQEEQEVA